MKEEKTQGIDTETTTKDGCNTNKTAKETELLDLRAGYNQHTSLLLLPEHNVAFAPPRMFQTIP